MLNSIQQDAKDAAAEHFRSPITAAAIDTHIVGWGIGTKVVNGTVLSDESIVRVYVRERLPEPNIPKQFGNLSTDVIEVRKITAYQDQDPHCPVQCGVSVKHPKFDAIGTLGCLVEKGGNHYILSNNHVLAGSNDAAPGDPIIQPGSNPENNIATLEPYKEIDFSGVPNHIDAAIARVGDCRQNIIESSIIDIGVPGGTPIDIELDQIVQKHGQRTGHTVGRVVDISADIRVYYPDHGYALFENQIGIKGIDSSLFGRAGDSGSLVVTEPACDPVGLFFACSDLKRMTFANPIRKVLGYYGVAIVGKRGADA